MNVGVANQQVIYVEAIRASQQNGFLFPGLVVNNAGGYHVQVIRLRLYLAPLQVIGFPHVVIVEYGDEGRRSDPPDLVKGSVPCAARPWSAPVFEVNNLNGLAREFVDYCAVPGANIGCGIVHHYQYVGRAGLIGDGCERSTGEETGTVVCGHYSGK